MFGWDFIDSDIFEGQRSNVLGYVHTVPNRFFFLHSKHSLKVSIRLSKVMFTLYMIGFCSVSKVAPVQCEQELIFCCVAEIVPKRFQCEQKPYPSYNVQRSILI